MAVWQFKFSLLLGLLAIARRAGCKIVLDGPGTVVDPDPAIVMAKLEESNAFRFCLDPEDYLRELARREDDGET